jgi:hypothetical protein
MVIGNEVVDNKQISYEEVLLKINELEKAMELLQSPGNKSVEGLLVYQFVLQGS